MPGRGPLAALLRARFDAYVEAVRRDLNSPLFGDLDRLVVLADLLSALHEGRAAFADAQSALAAAAGALRWGRSWTDWVAAFARLELPAQAIGRVAFVATKADHVAARQRGNLAALMRRLTRVPKGGATSAAFAIAAVRCTEDVVETLAGRPVSAVRGRIIGEPRPARSYPGEVPDAPPDDAFWQHRFLALPDFEPMRPPEDGRGGVPQIGLDFSAGFPLGGHSVMDTQVEPFLHLETDMAPRLELVPAVLSPTSQPTRAGRIPPALLGAGVLALGFPALWAAWLVGALFDRSAWLGWAGVALVLAGFGLVAAGIGRELHGLAALHRVDQLRAELASGEAERVMTAARRWIEALPQHAALLPALNAAGSPESVLAVLRAGPGTALRDGADALGRTAAFQAGAIVAATSSPGLDVLTVGWRGVRLVRQVASLHGMRPGLTGTLALLQRTVLAAASAAATQLAVNAAAHAIVSHPLLRHLLADVAGAGVAARRMMVLARRRPCLFAVAA